MTLQSDAVYSYSLTSLTFLLFVPLSKISETARQAAAAKPSLMGQFTFLSNVDKDDDSGIPFTTAVIDSPVTATL